MIFTAIATAIGLAGIAATAFVTVAEIGTSLLISYAAKALAGQPDQSTGTGVQGVQGTLQGGGTVPRSFGLGLHMTAGSLVYANTWGYDGSTPNAYLAQVIALSDLPGESLVGLWVNGNQVTIGASDTGFGKPIAEFNKDGKDHLWIRYYDGTQTTVDSYLNGTVASSDRPWGSDRVGKGVAYAIVTSLVEDTLFNGFPSFKFELSGIPLYDPSKDSTVGGSGSHVYSNPATWGGDGDNFPAVQIYNVLRGISYNGTWLYGLQNTSAARLPASNWIAQIAKCRATVTGAAGPEPSYRAGGQVNVDAQPANLIESLLTACQGKLSEIGGFYKVHLGAPDSTTFTFTDDDILSTETQTYRPFFSLADSVNGIQAQYPDPTQAWSMVTAPPYYRTDLEAKDGNRRLMASPSFDFVPYPEQVQRLQKSAIEEAQRARGHTITLPPAFWVVEPGDVGEWTSVRNGYVSKQFRVDGAVDKANLDTTLNLTEVDPTDYDWNRDTDLQPVTGGGLLSPPPTPQGILAWAAEGVTLYDADGLARRPAIRLTWDGTVPGVIGVQYDIRLANDASDVGRGRTDQLAAGAIIISQNLLPQTQYQVRGQYIPNVPRDMLWSDWIDVTTPDVRMSLADFNDAIIAQINGIEQFDGAQLQATINLIASLAANQDARNWLDKKEVRSQLDAVAGTAKASIAQIQSVMADDEAAFAHFQTEVSATFGPAFSSVNTVSSAVATLEGYAASSYSVTLDVNGYATGFELVNGGSGVSSFTVTTDKFQIAAPGTSGGAPVPIFTVANVNGVPKVALRADLFSDKSVNASAVNAGTLSAITGNVGLLNAGKIQSTTGKMVLDLDNEYELVSD